MNLDGINGDWWITMVIQVYGNQLKIITAIWWIITYYKDGDINMLNYTNGVCYIMACIHKNNFLF